MLSCPCACLFKHGPTKRLQQWEKKWNHFYGWHPPCHSPLGFGGGALGNTRSCWAFGSCRRCRALHDQQRFTPDHNTAQSQNTTTASTCSNHPLKWNHPLKGKSFFRTLESTALYFTHTKRKDGGLRQEILNPNVHVPLSEVVLTLGTPLTPQFIPKTKVPQNSPVCCCLAYCASFPPQSGQKKALSGAWIPL